MNYLIVFSVAIVITASGISADCGCECPLVCPSIYDPVCAINQCGNTRTFASECVLDNAVCSDPCLSFTLLHQGECAADLEITDCGCSCQDICPDIYLPVCAKDKCGNLQTFGNACSLASAICQKPCQELTFYKDGAC